MMIDEWVFAAWAPDATFGIISGLRLLGHRMWYWSALVQEGAPLLHLAEFDAARRPDPFLVKAPEMWAEHHCLDLLRQWSIGNEAFFTELDDPADALGRCFGTPRPVSFDLEWYATGSLVPLGTTRHDPGVSSGFEQAGVVHGVVEMLHRPHLEVAEIPAYRWRRWSPAAELAPIELPRVVAHTDLRAPFSFPDGAVSDWVLTSDGWWSRR